VLPLVLTGTAAGTLMSLGLNGSTFGIFPLLVLAIAAIVRDLKRFLPGTMRLAPVTGAVLALFLTMSGAAYTLTNARLLFVDANAAWGGGGGGVRRGGRRRRQRGGCGAGCV